jgi:hypothetical protein
MIKLHGYHMTNSMMTCEPPWPLHHARPAERTLS